MQEVRAEKWVRKKGARKKGVRKNFPPPATEFYLITNGGG